MPIYIYSYQNKEDKPKHIEQRQNSENKPEHIHQREKINIRRVNKKHLIRKKNYLFFTMKLRFFFKLLKKHTYMKKKTLNSKKYLVLYI